MIDWSSRLDGLTLAQSKLLNLIFLYGVAKCRDDYSPAKALIERGLARVERRSFGFIRLLPPMKAAEKQG